MPIERMSDYMPFSCARPGEARRAAILLGGSLFLHALLLAWVNTPATQRAAPALLIKASLRSVLAPAVSASLTASVEQRRPESATHKQVSLQAPALSKSRPVDIPRPAAPEVRQPQSPSELRPVAEANGAARPSISTSNNEKETAPPMPDQNKALGRYARQLSQLLAGHQDYPRLAALRGWEGEVRLHLKVARKGNLLSIHVDRSSGFDVLDQHALQLVDLANSLPPLPDELEGQEIQVIVPVNYKLRKSV